MTTLALRPSSSIADRIRHGLAELSQALRERLPAWVGVNPAPVAPLDRRQRGEQAEAFARRWLKKQGCKILAVDVGDRFGQLDIVVRPPEGGVAVVEVRSHAQETWRRDDEILPWSKREQVVRTARRLLSRAQLWSFGQDLRFDAVFVGLGPDGRPLACRHLPNAFQPSRRDWG